MLIVVFVRNFTRRRVVRRVDVNALHLLMVAFLEQVERLEVFAVDEQAVALFVEASDAFEHVGFETRIEVSSIEHEVGVAFEESWARIFAPLELRDAIPVFPNRKLRLVGQDIGIKRLGQAIEGNAVLRFHDELSLFPDALLEVFYLRHPVDKFVSHLTHGENLVEQRLYTVDVSTGDIIEEEYFVLDEKIKLTTQESTEIFVDKEVGSLLLRVAIKMIA